MPNSRPLTERNHGRFAANLFAATVVLTCGLGVCLMIVFLFAPDAWGPLVMVVGGVAALSVLMLWLISGAGRRARAKDSNLYQVRKEMVDDYVESFRPRRSRRRDTNSARIGRQAPTTCGRSKKTPTPGTPPIAAPKITAAD